MNGETLRGLAAELENLSRGSPAEPYIAPLRALAERYGPGDDVDMDAYIAVFFGAVMPRLAADVALGHLGGPHHEAALAFLRGTWHPPAAGPDDSTERNPTR